MADAPERKKKRVPRHDDGGDGSEEQAILGGVP
jgi:hypothetical protein